MFDNLVLYFDGGSRGNPGIAGCAAVILDEKTGEKIVEAYAYLGKVTNNNAEYNGLILGFKTANIINPNAKLNVYADSKLVVEQMSGRWKIKNSTIADLSKKAFESFDNTLVQYFWVPREENKIADALANHAMDTKTSNTCWYKNIDTFEKTSINNANLSHEVEKTIPKKIGDKKDISSINEYDDNLKIIIVNYDENDLNVISNANTIKNILYKYDISKVDKVFNICDCDHEKLFNLVEQTANVFKCEIKKISYDPNIDINDLYYASKVENLTNVICVSDIAHTKNFLNYCIRPMLAKYTPKKNSMDIVEISDEMNKNTIIALGIKIFE